MEIPGPSSGRANDVVRGGGAGLESGPSPVSFLLSRLLTCQLAGEDAVADAGSAGSEVGRSVAQNDGGALRDGEHDAEVVDLIDYDLPVLVRADIRRAPPSF